ncbi:sulfotransferase [endosymbiont of unidentified scaly snail isolate Monju]|uniref:sulfotransferase n=1 Tax=endosymbiont of unidentified scaly snail isolate Monju TaxID=1248727 RepID=UPI001E637108
MEAYIRHLAARSEKPAVFKFVRASFRLSWLRKTFPEARIIWINRDPRKVWDSMQKRDTSIAAVPGNPEITQQGFSNYILQMAMEMGFSIRDDLYGTFYDMWVSSFMEAKNQVDDIWWYEDILADYPGWAKTHLVDAGITESIPPYEVKNPGTIYYANTVPRYLASELKQTLPSTSPPNHAIQRILDEVPSRNREIVLLQSRILDLEAELCRERERQYLSTRNPLYLLKEKAKKSWLKLQKRFIKL